MHSVEAILEAAARLSSAELRRLEEGIRRLVRQEKALHLQVGPRSYRLVRLSDGDLYDLLQRSIAIKDDLGFLIRLHLYRRQNGLRGPDFPLVDALLTHLTGPTSQRVDPWKGSFCFPFSVHFTVDEQEVVYLLEVYNNKDSIYYPLRKIVPADDERLKQHVYHPPVEAEFSRDQMNDFLLHFEERLLTEAEVLGTKPLVPFVRGVRASGIVYGLVDGEFFEEQQEGEQAWSAALVAQRRRVESEIDPNRGPA
jgi:hypothetical protein